MKTYSTDAPQSETVRRAVWSRFGVSKRTMLEQVKQYLKKRAADLGAEKP